MRNTHVVLPHTGHFIRNTYIVVSPLYPIHHWSVSDHRAAVVQMLLGWWSVLSTSLTLTLWSSNRWGNVADKHVILYVINSSVNFMVH